MKSSSIYLSVFILGISIAFSSAHAAKNHPVTGEALAEDQTFIYRELDEFPSFDPQLIESVSESAVARDLFEGLFNHTPEGKLTPGVALRWETNDAKNVYTFYLRQNAKWSNGDPVTAHDFVYAWQRLVDPKLASYYSSYMELMSVKNAADIIKGKKPPSSLGVKAVDDFTFQAELSTPIPYFPIMLAHASTMPVPKKVVEKLGDQWTKPGIMVGNGAYVLTEHVINERLVRVRNPMYWDNENTIIDKVIALIINDENQAFNRYQAEEVHRTEVPTGQYKRQKKQRPDETFSNPRLCSYYYMFNTTKAPYDDIRVRKALGYAIERNIITKNILQAGQIPGFTFTPGSTANFQLPEVDFSKMTQKERNEKAKKLLEEAGYGPGNPLKPTILYNTSEGHKKIAIAIRQMWKKNLGVLATLENQEWKTYMNNRHQQNFEVARAAWCGDYNEASTFLDLVRSDSDQNDGKYANQEVDKLIASAKTMSDPNPVYTRIEEIIASEAPITPIYHYTNVFMLKPFVKGWPHKNVENRWYSKDMYITAH